MERVRQGGELSVEDCIEDALNAWVKGRFTIAELREFHQEISALSRQAHSEADFAGDREAARFMHQVADGVLKRLRDSSKRTTEKIRRRSYV